MHLSPTSKLGYLSFNDISHYWNMKERVLLSNNQDGIIENY